MPRERIAGQLIVVQIVIPKAAPAREMTILNVVGRALIHSSVAKTSPALALQPSMVYPHPPLGNLTPSASLTQSRRSLSKLTPMTTGSTTYLCPPLCPPLSSTTSCTSSYTGLARTTLRSRYPQNKETLPPLSCRCPPAEATRVNLHFRITTRIYASPRIVLDIFECGSHLYIDSIPLNPVPYTYFGYYTPRIQTHLGLRRGMTFDNSPPSPQLQ